MHEIFHVIGLCPDNMSHPDLLDFLLLQREEIGRIFTIIKNYYGIG